MLTELEYTTLSCIELMQRVKALEAELAEYRPS